LPSAIDAGDVGEPDKVQSLGGEILVDDVVGDG
jgi:hypothetical protein